MVGREGEVKTGAPEEGDAPGGMLQAIAEEFHNARKAVGSVYRYVAGASPPPSPPKREQPFLTKIPGMGAIASAALTVWHAAEDPGMAAREIGQKLGSAVRGVVNEEARQE